ncbi:MAG: hypothetical protein QNJ46_07690 [Leptolyngbyaceae cyanobacterium MO_188.B28]|nr:hypothetical protein [Leptolyngbyaceae cyanobacterium MO_188.B28]
MVAFVGYDKRCIYFFVLSGPDTTIVQQTSGSGVLDQTIVFDIQ